MMKYHEALASERANRREKFEKLESLEGYKKLSPKQQQMMRLSLYIQDRSERPFARNKARRLYGETFPGNYSKSHQHIWTWYCHPAVFYLENELPLDYAPEGTASDGGAPAIAIEKTSYPPDFFDGFIEVPRNRIEDQVRETGFPAVIAVWMRDAKTGGNNLYHSFVALGIRDDGQILAWEKEGALQPYGLVPLDRIKMNYMGDELVWGLRPFGKKSTTYKHETT
jgi:hypothetical protein